MTIDARRLISHQRVKDEGLEFVDHEIVGEDGQKATNSTITDAAGAVYHGVLNDNGSVSTDYCHYDTVETYQRVQGPFEYLCSFYWNRKHRHHIVRDQNRDLYLYHYWENIGCSDHIEAIESADRLAEILFDDHHETDHSLIYEFTKSGHWAIRLPVEVRAEIERTTYHQLEGKKSRRDLVIERVRRPLKNAARKTGKEWMVDVVNPDRDSGVNHHAAIATERWAAAGLQCGVYSVSASCQDAMFCFGSRDDAAKAESLIRDLRAEQWKADLKYYAANPFAGGRRPDADHKERAADILRLTELLADYLEAEYREKEATPKTEELHVAVK